MVSAVQFRLSWATRSSHPIDRLPQAMTIEGNNYFGIQEAQRYVLLLLLLRYYCTCALIVIIR